MEAAYNTIGDGYNSTRRADAYIVSRLLHHLNLKTNGTYLDIGCGTGNYTIALTKLGLSFTGVEPSEKMLEEARKLNRDINWLRGTAEQIRVEDNSFNGIIATLTVHHWTDLPQAFKELYRVTKAGGKIVLFTATPDQMKRYWLNHYFPLMMEASTKQMPAFEIISRALTNAGFEGIATERYFIQDNLQDHFLYAGKNMPEIYFNNEIRKGISSFAALANTEEIKDGLATLYLDIKKGKFMAIIENYTDELGDYLFMIAEKK